MMAKRHSRMKPAVLWRYLVLAAGLLVVTLPTVFMISSSLRPNELTFTYPPRLLPGLREVTVENYGYILSNRTFWRYLTNTVGTALLSTAATALIASMLGYVIARFRFPGRRLLFMTIITTMLIPGLAMIVPQFELAVRLRLVDRLMGVGLFYTAWTVPFSTFLIKEYISGVPYELDEAIYMDGGTPFTVFFRVILPMAAPSIAAVSIFNFLFPFEELAWSQAILRSDSLRTIPVALTSFFQAHNRTDWGYVLAMTCLSMVPVLTIYVTLQKYFISGLSTGAVKG
jgi:multiple sugar transport system permease protein